MANSNFAFVKDPIRRQNIDEAFDHVLTLLPFSESTTYNEIAKSAFRKTIIIYTASIVEALLFDVLDSQFSDDDVRRFYASWEFKEKSTLYEVSASHTIVAGDMKKTLGKTGKEKLNLGQIVEFLRAKDILDKELFRKVDALRTLRNEQHIGSHKKVKVYPKGVLETAFSVAREVKVFVKNACVC